MYEVQTQSNSNPVWKSSPVRFVSEELALRHAEKLADQFISISDYRVAPVQVGEVA